MQITGNGESDRIRLYPLRTKVFVKYVGSASGTLTPQEAKAEGKEIPVTLPNGDTTITGSTTFIVEGPGLLNFNASGVSGVIEVDTENADGR